VITAHLVGDERALARLRDMPLAINSGLARAITKLGIDLQGKVQQDELSGQMLAARSGSLKSSIDLRVDQSATVVTATVFTDSAYAGAHEYGFAGTVNVRASLRRRPLGAQSPGRLSAFERTAAGWIFPSARFCARHSRTWGRPFAKRWKPLCAKR
jgi:hypothetical protein